MRKSVLSFRSLQSWFMAYAVTALLGILLTILTGKPYYLPLTELDVFRQNEGSSFQMSFLFPWLIQVPAWFIFSMRFLGSFRRIPQRELRQYALQLAIMWTGLSIAADFFAWVVAPTPFQMGIGELVSEYLPWLLLIYVTILGMTWCGQLPHMRRYLDNVAYRLM